MRSTQTVPPEQLVCNSQGWEYPNPGNLKIWYYNLILFNPLSISMPASEHLIRRTLPGGHKFSHIAEPLEGLSTLMRHLSILALSHWPSEETQETCTSNPTLSWPYEESEQLVLPPPDDPPDGPPHTNASLENRGKAAYPSLLSLKLTPLLINNQHFSCADGSCPWRKQGNRSQYPWNDNSPLLEYEKETIKCSQTAVASCKTTPASDSTS